MGLELLCIDPDVQQAFKGRVLNGPFVVLFGEEVISETHTRWLEHW